MSLTTAWASYFSSAARLRGREFFEDGQVNLQDPTNGELARAVVTDEGTFEVAVRRGSAGTEASCTCPDYADGLYCKHIWATLLAVDRKAMEDADADIAPSPGPRAHEQVGVQAPKARKRDSSYRPPRPVEPEWATRLSLLSPSRMSQQDPSAPLLDPRQVFYVISPEYSQQHGGLVIEVRFRQGSRGNWTGLKPMRISGDMLPEMTDATDRELCGLLLGATWVDQWDTGEWTRDSRRRSAFRLPVGTWRSMLKRMIDTRRCLFDRVNLSPRPLLWDGDAEKPWVLWMVGRHTDEGMSVKVELRRGEERVAINDPQLILGGSDGLVIIDGKASPFDDRDAFRWVTYFREDERRMHSNSPLMIPPRDVPKFLQRLYLLPDLPEIDLPTDVALMEQQVSPRPHIDILSPAGSASGLASKQLSGRVWFDYAGHQVQPGEPGRFVASTGEVVEEPEPATIAAPSAVLEGGRGEADETTFGDAPIPGAGLIRRDVRFERAAIESLAVLGFRSNPIAGDPTLVLQAKLMPSAVLGLMARGWVVRADRHIIRAAATPKLTIRSGVDWFELHGGVQFQTDKGDQFVALPEILAAARSGKNMITLGDGSQGMLPQEWLERHGLLTSLGKVEDDHLVFKNSQAALIDVLLDEQSLTDVDAKFDEARQKLRKFERIEPRDALTTFHGTLRPYQRDGLGWLSFLQWFGMGGILADDMGLGKTVQVLALLQAGKETGDRGQETGSKAAPNDSQSAIRHPQSNASRPSLVVAPRSVVFNWLDEAARFTPDLRVMSYSGAERHDQLNDLERYDLVVTSYGLLRRDIAKLRHVAFKYVILDEAQAIKNPNSQVAKASRLMSCMHRLALTGTPVENHLGDLWSIFEFLNPGMLGSATRFAEMIRGQRGGSRTTADEPDLIDPLVDVPGAAATGTAASSGSASVAPEPAATDDADQYDLTGPIALDDARHLDIAVAAARALKPFILRRTKSQVLTDLPEKSEQTIICEMDKAQRKVYDDLLKYYRTALLNKVEGTGDASIFTGGAGRAGVPMMVLEALLRLRQAACHPGLIDEKRMDVPSAKLETLVDQLAELIDEGHKALVFSQFTSMLAIVRKRMDEMGIVHEYLDGKTQDRRARVERFQTDKKCPVFLISLKAGGLGLNLTAADYVFILDPWWNPAVEQQAIDRAHRIGQTRHVFAYRLICKDTVEQRIAELQQKKKKLADAIIGGEENLLRTLTRSDLELLLS
ncbi:MAG: SNF2-related protein [Phycisphaeraceae bacterium]